MLRGTTDVCTLLESGAAESLFGFANSLVDGGEADQAVSSSLRDDEEGMVIAPVREPQAFINGLAKDPQTQQMMKFNKGTTTLGFLFKGGVLLAVDSRASQGSYISTQSVRKIIEINKWILGTMAGGAADCSFWERHLGRLCRLYELRHRERISVAAASNTLANIFFSYRGYGLCCATMVAGWDEREGPQLFFVSDDGTRLAGHIFSVGSGSTYAYGVLDNEYRYDLTLDEAVELGKRAIYHATFRDGASGGFCRVYHVHEKGWTIIEDGIDVATLHDKYCPPKKPIQGATPVNAIN